MILSQCPMGNHPSVRCLDVLLRDFVNKKHFQAMNTKIRTPRHTISASRDECAEFQMLSVICNEAGMGVPSGLNSKEALSKHRYMSCSLTDDDVMNEEPHDTIPLEHFTDAS